MKIDETQNPFSIVHLRFHRCVITANMLITQEKKIKCNKNILIQLSESKYKIVFM